MAAHKKKKQINLLPQEDFAASTPGRIVHWLLSTFRYLVITTEMIVITAFISRFYFDSRLADLNDEIKQKENYIRAYLTFENQFKTAQKRLTIFDEMTKEQNKRSIVTDMVISALPADIQLTQLALINSKTLQIQASSLSEQSIGQFLVNLGDKKEFEGVNLTQIDTKGNTPFINFLVRAKLISEELVSN